MPEKAGPPERSDPSIIRHLMPIVLVGFSIVSCALFRMQWPAPPGSETPTTFLALRMIRQAPDENGVALARHFTDFGIFLLAGIGLVAMAIAWWRGTRRPLIWMMATALMGIAYASGMAFYNGPMVSICGFTLILFGGMVAWVASSLRQTNGIESKTDEVSGSVEIRTNDHASTHSIA